MVAAWMKQGYSSKEQRGAWRPPPGTSNQSSSTGKTALKAQSIKQEITKQEPATPMADEAHPSGFDVYAPPFIPQAYRDINNLSANISQCVPVRGIDFPQYVSAFAGSGYLLADQPPPSLPEPACEAPRFADDGLVPAMPNHLAVANSGAEMPAASPSLSNCGLSVDNYILTFRNALTQESLALQRDCDRNALYRVPLILNNRDRRQWMFSLHVPGLRDSDSIRIEIGDTVHLRQLNFDVYGAPVAAMSMSAPDEQGRPHPAIVMQHDAVVWAIDRLREMLTLRVDWLLPGTMIFNVMFSVQQSRLGAMYRAVTVTQKALLDKADSWTRTQLFPQAADGVMQKSLNQFQVGIELRDQLLNYEQIRAVDTVLRQEYGHVPYLISGPPGTGKTKTLVELAIQLHMAQPTSHLVLCAPSDPASDTLVLRLQKYLKPSELLRLNAPSRSFPEVPENILPFCYVDEDMFGLPPFAQMMRYRIVVVTCRDTEILLRARLSNTDLYSLEQGVHSAIHPEQPMMHAQLHWTGLLIDEAAQATEPEALIPLSVVAPPQDYDDTGLPRPVVVMAGDQNQLGPRTACKLPVMQASLFERLLDRPIYRDHPLARSKQSRGVMRPLTKKMLPMPRPAFANLIRNYRSHPAILSVPSSLFYFNTLEPLATGADGLLEWEGWQGRHWPVLLAANTGKDEAELGGGGWFNYNEAITACRYAKSFIDAGLILPRDICIMSPFSAQVRKIRTLAKSAPFNLSAINIGPLEAFQGLESRLVILCTTRTRNRFIKQDIAQGLGVMHEPCRFNVALTRAKEGLIVIGNPTVLEQDPNWIEFLAFCQRNGLFDANGSEQTALTLSIPVEEKLGRLEKQLLHIEEMEGSGEQELVSETRTLGFKRDDEDDMWRNLCKVEAELREADGEVMEGGTRNNGLWL